MFGNVFVIKDGYADIETSYDTGTYSGQVRWRLSPSSLVEL